jgi:prefoldin subunit 5
MKKDNLSEIEPAQTEEYTEAELSAEPSGEQETQPMDIEADEEETESSHTPVANEPLPDPLGDALAEELEPEQLTELEQLEAAADQADEATPPLEETTPPPAAEAVHPPETTTASKWVTRSTALWMALAGMLLTFVLAVLFSLGLLAVVNGGLRYARPAQVESISGQLNGLNTQAVSLQREVDNLTARINTLEGLDARVAIVEKDAQLLQEDVNAASAALSGLDSQVGELRGQVAAVGSQIDELNTRTARFQSFLDGLRDLLGGVSQK